MREQRHDVRMAVACHVLDLEPDGARTGIQYLAPVMRAIGAIQRQPPTIVAEFADDELVPAIPIKVK